LELSWLMKLRIAAAAAIGVIVIGFLAWPLVAPAKPLGAVSVFANGIGFSDVTALGALAFFAGLLAYFVAWPYGREIGILAVPFGLAVWAGRSGSMAELMRIKPALAQRQELFAELKWEPLFWLAIVAVGFAGVILGCKVCSHHSQNQPEKQAKPKSSVCLNAALALVLSGLIAQFGIRILAQDVEVGTLVAQPATGQIVFAVLVSFGLAGFVVKAFLDASYIWPTIASALITGLVIITYVRPDVVEHLVQNWPAPFFSNTVLTILPLQMVAFGTLGSIAGYWLAVRYNYWRKHG
jgi:hypothetical protein